MYLKDQLIRTICEPAFGLKLLFGKCAGLHAPSELWKLPPPKDCPKCTFLFFKISFLKGWFSSFVTPLSLVSLLKSLERDKFSSPVQTEFITVTEPGLGTLELVQTWEGIIPVGTRKGTWELGTRTALWSASTAWKRKNPLDWGFFPYHFYPH